MISLIDYITESFIDYDIALENVPAKNQDVAKLKILIKKFDKFGEEDNYEDGKDPYDRLMKHLQNILKEKKFDDLEKERRGSYSEDYATKVKNRTKYCDKLFSAVHADFKKEEKKYGSADPLDLTVALIGIAYWIENFAGFKEAEVDKYLAKLCTKYQKVFGINPDEATKIAQVYDKQKVSIQQAIDLENKTKASVQGIKDDFKKHKYTVFAFSHDSAAKMFVISNKDFESLDAAYEATVSKETAGSPFEKYDLETQLRYLVKDGKIGVVNLCSGFYCFGEDKNKAIPRFGYYDEDIIGEEIYKYSGYDKKFYYSGMVDSKKNGAYLWYDSLWTSHTKK
jgi:hypothetical protein